MSKYPVYIKRKTINLNKLWDFKFLKNADFTNFESNSVEFDDVLPVPSAFDAFPAYNCKRGIGVYRCFVEVPVDSAAILKIGAAGMYCKVYIDGIETAAHYSAYTAFECEVPASDNLRREIVIAVCNRFDYDNYPLQEIFFDFYAYGGIFRDVELQILPKFNRLEWLGVDTLDYAKRLVKISVKASGIQNLTVNLDGKFHCQIEKADFAEGVYDFELELHDFSLWSPESPNLHIIEVDNGDDSIAVRFGIRQVHTDKGKILLNGNEIKLLGVCRHEAHPQFGPALPYQQLIADLQIIRDMGCNFIRGSHYAQDPRFLALCDEMGMLVFEESLGWGQSVRHFTDKKFIDAQLKQITEMISASYNNPSVIIRGFLNEGESDREESRNCYEALLKLIREISPCSLVCSASNKGLDDRFLELYDLVCFNLYPGWYSDNPNDENPLFGISESINNCISELKERGLSDKPFIISEIGAGAIYGWRDSACTHWAEEYQDEYLKIVCNEIANPAISGVALWQFCDCRTYRGAGAVMRPRSFNNKGILDEYRRPKQAYKTVKQSFQKLNSAFM